MSIIKLLFKMFLKRTVKNTVFMMSCNTNIFFVKFYGHLITVNNVWLSIDGSLIIKMFSGLLINFMTTMPVPSFVDIK